MVPVLRPLISPNNTINANPGNNSLVITDYADNLQRIAKIIDSIDQPSGVDPVIIPLQYASAIDVAQTVNRLFAETAQGTGGAEPNQRFVVAADTRSNSLLMRSGDATRLAAFDGEIDLEAFQKRPLRVFHGELRDFEVEQRLHLTGKRSY